MDLRRQLTIIRHWLWLFVAAAVLCAAGAFLVSSSLPKTYESRATLIVGQSLSAVDPNYNQILASQRLSLTYARLATTTPVLAGAIGQLGLQTTSDELREKVTAQAPRDTTLVTVMAADTDPNLAAAIANAIADQLVASSPALDARPGDNEFLASQIAAIERQIVDAQAELDRLLAIDPRSEQEAAQVDTIQARLVSLRQTYADLLAFAPRSGANLLTIVEPAAPASEPSSPQTVINTLLAALLGLVGALGLALLIEHLDDTVKSPDDVTEVVELPTLGVIAQMRGKRKGGAGQMLVTLHQPRSQVAEAIRTLRTNIEFASLDTPLRTLLVTSPVPGEGKSTVAANVAIAFAQAGKRVLLLDADMRRPTIHRLLEMPNTHGLTTLLRDDQLSLGAASHSTAEPNLRVVTTGPLPPNPSELLASKRMASLVRRMRDEADLIVVDSPPLHAVTDAAVLASQLDATLVVAHAGRTKRAALAQAREALRRVGARVLGVTLNQLTERTAAGYYYRSYGDYAGTASKSPAATTARGATGR